MAATLAVFCRRTCQIALPSLCRHYVPQTKHPLVSYTQTLFPALLHTNTPASVSSPHAKPRQETLADSEEETQLTHEVISKVNHQLTTNSQGRLFAVVHICGKQFKVTDEDIIVVEGYWPPQLGDRLRLEKVLVVGGSDLTLLGRPLLSRDLVSVEATVIEKTLSHVKTHFRKKRRKQYMRMNFHRSSFTMLRINSVSVVGQVNERREMEGLEGRIF